MLLPELCKQYRRRAVQCQDSTYIYYTVFETGITERRGDLPREEHHEGQEGETDAEYRGKRIGVDRSRIHAFAVCKPKTAGFQSQHENYLKHSNICHEFRYDSIAGCGQQSGVERYEKKVYYPGQDSAEAVYRGFASKLFQRICHIFNAAKFIFLKAASAKLMIFDVV